MSTTDQFRSIAASPREQLAASISSRPVTRKQASQQKLNHVAEGQKAPFRRCGEHFSFAPICGGRADLPDSTRWAQKGIMSDQFDPSQCRAFDFSRLRFAQPQESRHVPQYGSD